MSPLPSGTVTFLFTDIEGSTALWEQYPDGARQALVRHDALVEQIVAEHGGHVVRPRGEGDSRFAVFARATDAVATAAALQQALHAEPWPIPIRVRMALHTGEADLRAGDYYGTAVNRCARLRAVAHGGQTLLSQATYALVCNHPLPGVEFRDLGAHRLKDLQRPEHIFQLVMADLPADFPPLPTLEHRSTNLPIQPTPFIGRERAVVAIRNRLLRPEVRLLTLTGPGGTGKTRLALQVAAELLEHFPDGVWFVDLAPLRDPALVVATTAATLGVRESGSQPVVASLSAYLAAKQLLLLLDNFEQVLAAAPLVAELIQAAPYLTVLVTSRAVLHLAAEHEYPVPPLDLPNPHHLPPLEHLSQYEAVRLFITRAQAIKPDFMVTTANGQAIAEICHRLDGLPLAIELAAARIRLFTPEALLKRLERRLPLLTGGARDLPSRQQTLRNTIEWSYNLLNAAEQTLFRRLAVFVGGCTFESIEAVCNSVDDLTLDVVNGVMSLLDKSLLWQEARSDGEPRFTMLETIREYALERLELSEEVEVIRRRHAWHYLSLAEAAEQELTQAAQGHWLQRLEVEHDNVRVALAWCQTPLGDMEAGLRIVGAIWRFWWRHGYLSEGRQYLAQILAHAAAPTLVRAKALSGAGMLAWAQGDYAGARALHEESLAIRRALGDKWGIAMSLNNLGLVTTDQGDHAGARALHEESLTIRRALGDKWSIAMSLNNLGLVAYCQGDYVAARTSLTESLTIGRELGDKQTIAASLNNLGLVSYCQGDYVAARTSLTESLTIARELGDTWSVTGALTGIAGVAAALAQPAPAARLLAATAALLETIGGCLDAAEQAVYERTMAAVRAALSTDAFAAAWAEGRAMTRDQAITYALEEAPDA